MSKDSIIRFRVTDEEKKKAIEIVEKSGFKNISDLFRSYINDCYEVMISAPEDKTSLLFYIARLRDERNSKKDLSDWEVYEYNKKISLLENIYKNYKDE